MGGQICVGGNVDGTLVFAGDAVSDVNSSDAFVVCALDSCAFEWAQRFSGGVQSTILALDSSESESKLAIAGEVSGDVFLGSSSLAGAELRGFVALVDAQGEPLWAKTLGNGSSTASGVKLATNVVLVAGSFTGQWGSETASGVDGFVSAFDISSGAELWTVFLSGAGTQLPVSIDFDGAGILVSGWYEGDFSSLDAELIPSEAQDPFLMRIAKNGSAVEWVRSVRGRGSDYSTGAVIDSSGTTIAVAGGYLSSELEFGDGISVLSASRGEVYFALLDWSTGMAIDAWTTSSLRGAIGLASLHARGDGFVVAGSIEGEVGVPGLSPLIATGGRDGLVLQLGRDGSARASTMLAGTGAEQMTSAVPMESGAIVVSGMYEAGATLGDVALPESANAAGFVGLLDLTPALLPSTSREARQASRIRSAGELR